MQLIVVQCILPATFILSVYTGNIMIIIWTFYVLFPVLDYFLPHDNWNPEPKITKVMIADKRYLIPLYWTFFADIAIWTYCLFKIS